MKGDSVEIVVDAGGEIKTYQVVATRAGRRVEVSTGRGIVEVTEVTRTGTPVRTARFMASRVVALVEQPAPRLLPDDDRAAGGRQARRGPATAPGRDDDDGGPGAAAVRAV